MTSSKLILRVFIAVFATYAIQILAGMIFPPRGVVPVPHILQWMFFGNALIVVPLSIVALRSDWRGWRLGVAVAIFPWAIASVNCVEGAVFLPNSHIDWTRVLLDGGVSGLLSIPVWMLLFGRRVESAQEHYQPFASKTLAQRSWRFVVSDFSYLVLYFVAGSIIFPFVQDFYATQKLPSPSTIVALQLLLRGPVFVILCLLLVRMLGMPRLSGAFLTGAVFTMISGVSPLIIPNPYFPDSVRWTHFWEVTISNLLFGAIVAWLWGSPKIHQKLATDSTRNAAAIAAH